MTGPIVLRNTGRAQVLWPQGSATQNSTLKGLPEDGHRPGSTRLRSTGSCPPGGSPGGSPEACPHPDPETRERGLVWESVLVNVGKRPCQRGQASSAEATLEELSGPRVTNFLTHGHTDAGEATGGRRRRLEQAAQPVGAGMGGRGGSGSGLQRAEQLAAVISAPRWATRGSCCSKHPVCGDSFQKPQELISSVFKGPRG